MFFAILCFAPCCLIKPLEQQGPTYAYEVKYTINGDDSLYSRRFYKTAFEPSSKLAYYYFFSIADTAIYSADYFCSEGNFAFRLEAELYSDTSFFESGKYYPYKPKSAYTDNTIICNIGAEHFQGIVNEGTFSFVLGPSEGLLYTFYFDFDVFKQGAYGSIHPEESYSIRGSVAFTRQCKNIIGNPAGYIVKK